MSSNRAQVFAQAVLLRQCLGAQEPEGLVGVVLTHCVPNLDCFEIQVDGGARQRVGCGVHERVFKWQLHPGSNAIKAGGVNKSGLATREAAITVEYSA